MTSGSSISSNCGSGPTCGSESASSTSTRCAYCSTGGCALRCATGAGSSDGEKSCTGISCCHDVDAVTMTTATAPINSTVPTPPTASARPERRARRASHWLNSQLASEATIVSKVTMTAEVTMAMRVRESAPACARRRLPSIPLRAESRTTPGEKRDQKKGFSTALECFTIRAMTSRDSKPGASAARTAAAGPVYEQPLNERMRTFLRLDFLYQQALFHEEREDAWSTRAAVGSLLEILAITARGDVRSEVLKELERQMSIMADYQTRPGVDSGRLRAVLSNLERLRTELNAAGALFMQRLRDSEFLNAIKHRSTIPGGTCEFDLPDYR